MATVAELSEPYAAFMRNPLAPGSDQICEVCLRFTEGRFPTCYQCGHRDRHTDAVLPVSYTGKDGQLYHSLAQYKRHWDQRVARQLGLQLALVMKGSSVRIRASALEGGRAAGWHLDGPIA